MKPLAELARRLRMLFRRQQFDHDMDDEMRVHLELREKEYAQNGFSPEEAYMAARKNFGNALAIREVSHDSWGWAWLRTSRSGSSFRLPYVRKKSRLHRGRHSYTGPRHRRQHGDIFRRLWRLAATVALQDASHLVVLNETTPMVGTVSVSYPNFHDWRQQSHSFSQIAAVQDVGFDLAGVTQPENISGEAVSPNFLSMIGVRPFLGRDFEASEEKPGTPPVVLLSYELWQSHMGSDRNAIGRTITLDGRSFTIVGVLPPNFRSLDKTDVMLPIGVWATNNSGEANDRGDRAT